MGTHHKNSNSGDLPAEARGRNWMKTGTMLRGLAAQTVDDPAAIGAADLQSATDALVRAAFFDLTFVLDAYLDAGRPSDRL